MCALFRGWLTAPIEVFSRLFLACLTNIKTNTITTGRQIRAIKTPRVAGLIERVSSVEVMVASVLGSTSFSRLFGMGGSPVARSL